MDEIHERNDKPYTFENESEWNSIYSGDYSNC